jgi:hypothetical protein
MLPHEAALLLQAELQQALADLSESAGEAHIRDVRPPPDLGPGTAFRVSAASGSCRVELELPSGLAVAYLADEEAAVDEWKHWVAALVERLGMT